MASFIRTVIAPATPRSSAVIGLPVGVGADDDARRARCACPSGWSASARMAITSLATAMSNPVWRGKPFAPPPRPDDDVAQRAVVDVHDAAPGDGVGVDVQPLEARLPEDVAQAALVHHARIDGGGQQVVGRR